MRENNNAVVYARYSSHGQNEQSIDQQKGVCEEYAKRNGYNIVGYYSDEAKSGTKAGNLDDFQRMIKDSRQRQFDTVIVWKFDRFARSREDSAHYKSKLKKNGGKVLSAMEPVSEGAAGIILESMLEGMAEYYSANL